MNDNLNIKWIDHQDFIEIVVPEPFSFKECLVYLNRSDAECLHQVKDERLIKLVKLGDDQVLLKVSEVGQNLQVDFLNIVPTDSGRAQVAKYIWDLFDMGTDISPFYEMAAQDSILRTIAEKYKGLRIIKINDLFECLSWAVMGQQINLKFAYTLKKRLVEKYGEKLIYEGESYYSFPTPRVISALQVEDLLSLQFTTRKAEYMIGIAKQLEDGLLIKEELELESDYVTLLKKLISIRGIGNWTADYTIMKCFSLNCAFPLADVGIHNAIKGILGLKEKPKLSEIQEMARNWEGWESYAAFYLWRWLYD